ncbi:HAD-IIB family hydrolase [Xanthobacter sp. V4C-4]|uniref:HAD-IIB family hydrolase n=1 Tax=Xanthobacter cornucopiae TaxID=3119924 RepID=UPI00372C5F4A
MSAAAACPVRPAAAGWRLVLATDLDGTFLGGTPEDRARLYRWIARHRAEIGLVFVTGRDLDFIRALCAGAVADAPDAPSPDYVVADVGTTVARMEVTDGGPRLIPLAELEAPIAAAWGDRSAFVRATLADQPGLRLQETAFRHRVSYHYDPARHDPAATAPLRAAGLDILVSAGRFLDVLPGGVNKGSTLLALLDHLALDRDRVLVAGDTLNDLAMFRTGLRGAVVGGAEPALLAETGALPRVRHCRAAGAAGIAEAISAFGLHPQPPEAFA